MTPLWLEIGKVLATPIAVATLGFLLLRRVESIKAVVARQSDFQKKWADEFFTSCQQFMQCLERELALLTIFAGLKDPNEKRGTAAKEEISQLHSKLPELELRIRLRTVFAPTTGEAVIKAANDTMALTRELLASGKGDVDQIVSKMNEFNRASRRAHAEMLGLKGDAKPSSSL